MKTIKSDLAFKIDCIRCGHTIDITFDRDGDVEGEIMGCGQVWSDLFDDWCTPLTGGFREFFCREKIRSC